MAEPGRLFQLLAGSFPALVVLFCALACADHVLTIYGYKLYLRSGRQFHVLEHYELNPMWREVVEQGRYWSPKLLLRFAPCVVLAGLLWFLPVYLKLSLTWQQRPYAEPLIAGARVFCWVLLAAMVSALLVVLAVHLENIVLHARLMRPGFVSGQVRYSAEFGYGRTRLGMFAFAGVCSLLAVLQPTPVTIGFALGPLMLALVLWRMQRRPAVAATGDTESADQRPPRS